MGRLARDDETFERRFPNGNRGYQDVGSKNSEIILMNVLSG
jgi:hypothetical protein